MSEKHIDPIHEVFLNVSFQHHTELRELIESDPVTRSWPPYKTSGVLRTMQVLVEIGDDLEIIQTSMRTASIPVPAWTNKAIPILQKIAAETKRQIAEANRKPAPLGTGSCQTPREVVT